MVEAAFDWLKDNAGAAAAAKAERIRAEYATKQAKARLFLECGESSVAAKEAWAIIQPEYDKAVEREAEAVEIDEFHRNQRSKAEAIIEAWRTEQASLRAMTKVG